MLQNARRIIAKTIGKPWDTYALQLLNVELADALPWTSSAPRPGLVCCLINDIRINRRRTVVEFGSSERKIARLWSDLLEVSFSYQLLRGSFAVGVKGAKYNSLI